MTYESNLYPSVKISIGDTLHSLYIEPPQSHYNDIPKSTRLYDYDIVQVDRTHLPNDILLILKQAGRKMTIRMSLLWLFRLNGGELKFTTAYGGEYALSLKDQFSTTIG
jgi:hypothetical protein